MVLVDLLDRFAVEMVNRYGEPKIREDGTGKYFAEIVEKPECLKHVGRYYRRYGMPADLAGELLGRAYETYKPAAVLVGSMMTYWYPGVAEAVNLARDFVPDTPVGLGGIYARLMPEHAQKVSGSDRVFVKRGYSEVLAWLGELTGREKVSRISDDLNDWPEPAYDLYGRLEYLALITSLGCPYRCDYCASGFLQGKLRQLAAGKFVGQLTELAKLLGPRKRLNIALADDALLVAAPEHFNAIMRQAGGLSLPFRFQAPNGLHARFIDEEVANLMYTNNFEMIRLSYEASTEGSVGQRASDSKINDKIFRKAVANLLGAGYKAEELEVYILAGLPGQEPAEVAASAAAVHDSGLQIRLCQYTPIPGTPFFARACAEYGIDPDEPLLHNNSIIPVWGGQMATEKWQKFKNEIGDLNRKLD